jgi:dipeptidyl-peptidase-3
MASSFIADSEAPIIQLSAKKNFEQLSTEKEKLYAHYLSRASHLGTRAVLRSVSPESEDIYELILKIHNQLGKPSSNDEYIEKLSQIDSTTVLKYLEYASQFLSNLGNYKSFGDKKFIPSIVEDEFAKLVASINDAGITQLYDSVKSKIYDTSAGLLGWRDQGHVSAYYPGVLYPSKSEIELINTALADQGLMPENTRVEKVNDHEFIVHVASALTENTVAEYQKPIKTSTGATIVFKFGDHSKEFTQIVRNLEKAKENAANETQVKMIEYYIESFKTGSMNAHKKSQIQWVKDLGPSVENNIGFIETYRDPSGVRGEWEGLVAMVNKDRTAKFANLVENAGQFISILPWDKSLEKDVFTPPDFTSLEVLTFAGSGIPAGINIPNYDDVRLNIGFKNVSLGNVLSANPKKPKKEEVITFLNEDLKKTYLKWRDDAFEIQVGLHELLGHGTGKLLQEVEKGKFNFDKEKLDYSTWYKPNETWGSLFGSIAGSYEECRAELVALYLILKAPKEVLPIFDIKPEDFEDIKLIATVSMARAGLLGLEFWDPNSRKWGQPHMQARFGIFKSLHQAGVVELTHTQDDYSDLELVVDTSKLDDVAVKTLGDFLEKLHTYKCTANFKQGAAFYNDITNVTEDYAKYRDIVLEKKRPRKQLIQANTFVDESGKIELREYNEEETGMIISFDERAI